MEHLLIVLVLAKVITILSPAAADTYSVRVGTESHVNLVDTRFLSFTIDPKYLFSSSGKYKTKECICMASSLTPAYIRIAGPSTSQTTFHNSTISIDALKLLDDENSPQRVSLNEYRREKVSEKLSNQLSVTHEDWKQFVQWAQNTGFSLVFALNNEEKTANGLWDPNTALNILTVADKADIGDIFWQLGYACNNQSIEEYLNDLETLRVITDTFPSGRAGRWRVVGGDVTPCLAADSKSDFKDYVALSDEMFDAVFLNGNSSSQELERMSEKDRLKLLKILSRSDTPLWLTEANHRWHELERAADWMTSLGYSAKNGFAVHFRDLVETELYEPTLSFYMALLFKNLVGEKVLNVDIEASDATMFAHCTSLRHKPVPGAVTLYGANMDNEPARFSVKLSKKEEGGDIMQFILGHDHSGNILVNGRAMYHEGDIKPVVKRVRPYKTLLINLPPKSFGFWVLANTQVDACYDDDDKEHETQYVEALSIPSSEDNYSNALKYKRSIDRYAEGINKESSIDFIDLFNDSDLAQIKRNENKALKSRIDDLNKDLTSIRNNIACSKYTSNKVKRQTGARMQRERRNRPSKYNMKSRVRQERNYDVHSLLKSKLMSKLRNSKLSRLSKYDPSRVNKRNSNGFRARSKSKKNSVSDNADKKSVHRNHVKTEPEPQITNPDCDTLRKRKRRSLDKEREIKKALHSEENGVGDKKIRNINHNYLEEYPEDEMSENEVDDYNEGIIPVGKVLHKLRKISRFPVEINEKHIHNDLDDSNEEASDMNEIVLKTKILDDSAIINISEKSKNGFLKSTMQDILFVLSDLNKKLSKVWSSLPFVE